MTTELPTTCGAAVRSSDLCRTMAKECGGVLEADDFMRLDADEIQILYHRFVEGRTLEETGRIVRNKVNNKPANPPNTQKRQNKALQKLRRYSANAPHERQRENEHGTH